MPKIQLTCPINVLNAWDTIFTAVVLNRHLARWTEQEKNSGLPVLDIQLTSKECWTKHESETRFGYIWKRIQPCSMSQEQIEA